MAYFDRFDICEAYYAVLTDYNRDGLLPERDKLKQASTSDQLYLRIGFRPSPFGGSYDALTENGMEIYDALVERLFSAKE